MFTIYRLFFPTRKRRTRSLELVQRKLARRTGLPSLFGGLIYRPLVRKLDLTVLGENA